MEFFAKEFSKLSVYELYEILKSRAEIFLLEQNIICQDMDDTDEMKYGLNGSPTQVSRIFPPEVNDHREMWTGTGEELTQRLEDKLVALKFI